MCLCTLDTVRSLRAFHFFSLFFFSLLAVVLFFFFGFVFIVDCMIVHGVVVMVCSVCSVLFLFLYKFSFCVFLSAHCVLAFSWGSCVMGEFQRGY